LKKSPDKLFFFLLLLMLLAGFCASDTPAREPNLMLLFADGEQLGYINMATLYRSSDNVVSFWKKVIPGKRSRDYREIQLLLEKAEKDSTRFDFFQTLDEVDCANNKARTLSVQYYDRDRNILLSHIMPNAEWINISHWNEGELMREVVCRNPVVNYDDALSALHPFSSLSLSL
jgi:hypothetical protein